MNKVILIAAIFPLIATCHRDVSPQERAARMIIEANVVQAPQVEVLQSRLSILEARIEILERVCSRE